MTAPRAPIPANPADYPLRASLARGDAAMLASGPALLHALNARDRELLNEAVIAQVGGMIADLARQLTTKDNLRGGSSHEKSLLQKLAGSDALLAHCHALALEWQLALRLEEERALDPVLSPVLQDLVQHADDAIAALAMAALAAQARFAQSQRRMELPLGELPAELYNSVLMAAASVVPGWNPDEDAELRAQFDEGAGRLALLARLSGEGGADIPGAVTAIEQAGAALWLSVVALRSAQSRERVVCAAAASELGRILLTLRAAGVQPADAERQVLVIHPEASPPPGLPDIGIREAAQWLADARP